MALFGSSTGAFGQAANNTGLFGQTSTQAPNQSQQQTGLFGGSLLGQSTQQQAQQQPAGASLNASQALNQLKSSIWEPGRESTNHKPIDQQMDTMVNKWTPSHPDTSFKYYFYNRVDKSRIPFYQPGPGEDPREWEQANHEKPKRPSKENEDYVPVLATGFHSVFHRIQMQKNVLANYRQALHAINNSLDAILSQNDLQISVRAVNARRKHAILQQRCLALASKVQVLRNRGYTLDSHEDELKTKLESLDQGLSDPALSARTEELWSRLLLLRGYADTLRNEIDRRGSEVQEGIGEEVEAKAKKILEDYEKQLTTLKKQVESIDKDFKEWQADANVSSSK
ncbi:nucleoporin complex subunit 54-domain-containing protein [Xylariaceae sp. FL0804]|nr:nucleoporin complex subunit 54-domain-containing protein [Xylariaceae sp. FL0804]